jgi:hypothetical protein
VFIGVDPDKLSATIEVADDRDALSHSGVRASVLSRGKRRLGGRDPRREATVSPAVLPVRSRSEPRPQLRDVIARSQRFSSIFRIIQTSPNSKGTEKAIDGDNRSPTPLPAPRSGKTRIRTRSSTLPASVCTLRRDRRRRQLGRDGGYSLRVPVEKSRATREIPRSHHTTDFSPSLPTPSESSKLSVVSSLSKCVSLTSPLRQGASVLHDIGGRG